MKYQEELLTIFLYLGYVTAIGILIIILLVVGTLIYQALMNWAYVYKKIHDRALNKRLYKISEENLEKWFDDIRERHKRIKKWTEA
ncbi:hypothetical protein N5912_07590 [Arcobacter lacus]|uniref:hypothetical protein n=1 Tax=Arcobacter lacus TaxID=1912876 RepID=UPI0021BB3243|nr:hypothetical protein [Arcobacter lacus]MCT7911688.1 hypothetical protein [Arcobacter lacus]